MCILLQFNRAITVSYQDLKAATSIQPESELKRHLVSLCTPKNRILLKGSKGKLVTGACHAPCVLLGARRSLSRPTPRAPIASYLALPQMTIRSRSTLISSPR